MFDGSAKNSHDELSLNDFKRHVKKVGGPLLQM